MLLFCVVPLVFQGLENFNTWVVCLFCLFVCLFAYRAPQRAATPPQKMRTSKVGAGPLLGEGRQQCPRYLGFGGAPALPAPRTKIGGSFYLEEGLA